MLPSVLGSWPSSPRSSSGSTSSLRRRALRRALYARRPRAAGGAVAVCHVVDGRKAGIVMLPFPLGSWPSTPSSCCGSTCSLRRHALRYALQARYLCAAGGAA
eukprot:7063246-Alexandrium_andersonii.AAC.1